MSLFTPFEDKMRSNGIPEVAIKTFRHNFETLLSNDTGLIPESSNTPASDVSSWQKIIAEHPEAGTDIIRQTVCIKLNGGLGTSMGLKKVKTLLKVKGEDNFLDIIVKQIRHLRHKTGYPVRLLLMHSPLTSGDSLDYLSKYADEGFNNPDEVELRQNIIPKIVEDTMQPASWPANPDLEWCPSGHGDLYPALEGSGWLDRLLADGVKYAFVSNSDNLGAQLNLHFLNWFAQSATPFVMEVTERTPADKKGGHIAIRKSDRQLILREIAQCPEEDLSEFQNIGRHHYFNTNNLWIRLDILKEILEANNGILPIPMICNKKTLDPRDPESPAVLQLEIAMGAGIECFKGAMAVNVPRSRFFPVKTCSDLFLLRSDAIECDSDGRISLAPSLNGRTPIVDLDPQQYKLFDSLDALGMPSL